MGSKIWRLGVYGGGELMGIALVVKVEAKRGTFLFVPHLSGFKIYDLRFKILECLVSHLKDLAKKEGCSLIRIAPVLERTEKNAHAFKELGFREAPIHMHPEVTWELDIRGPEEEILAGMRKTTRYLIRRGQKDSDIKIEQSDNLEKFQQLYDKTIERHHFVGFPPDYLKNEFLAFAPDNQISLFLGSYKGKVLSGAIVIFWQGIAFYHHGASLPSKTPVSYLLQWGIIKEAKRRGCTKYNFWGIAPNENPNHPWRGLTLFKTGFGGQRKDYLKTQDLPLSFRYWLTYIFEKARKIKRGL